MSFITPEKEALFAKAVEWAKANGLTATIWWTDEKPVIHAEGAFALPWNTIPYGRRQPRGADVR